MRIASRAAMRCLRDERGLAALEFALIGPALVLALLWTADLGFAFTERMAIDHALRSGAQAAMADHGALAVGKVVQATAQETFQVTTAQDADKTKVLIVNAPRVFCACPETAAVETACTNKACGGSAPPLRFYELKAQRSYAGLLKTFSLDQSVRVQVR